MNKKAEKKNLNFQRPVTHEDRIRVFRDTQNWIKSDPDLSRSVIMAKKKTKVYYEDDYPIFDAGKLKEEEIIVTPERSFEAAMRLAAKDPQAKIAVMNFANALISSYS